MMIPVPDQLKNARENRSRTSFALHLIEQCIIHFRDKGIWAITLLLVSVLGFFQAEAQTGQATRIWALTTGGSWATASNWSPSGVPQAGDNVVINGITGAGSIKDIPTIALTNLTLLGNCTLDAATKGNTITVNGTMTVASGITVLADKFELGINIAAAGIANVDGTLNMTLYGQGGIFTNNGRVNLGASAIIGGTGSFVLSNNATLAIGSTAGIMATGTTGNIRTTTRTFNANANYIYTGAAAQNTGDALPATFSGSLTIDNPTTVTLSAARTFSSGNLNLLRGQFIAGTLLTLGNSTTASNVTINRRGGSLSGTPQSSNWYNIVYNGASKITGPEISGTGMRSVTVNLDPSNDLTLDANRTVPGTLTLTEGNLITGSFALTLSNTSGVALSGGSASSYINGTLIRGIATGSGSYFYPIGTAAAYAPVTMNMGSVSAAGTLTGFTTNGDDANISGSDINTFRTVNRSWNFTKSGALTVSSFGATFEWFGDQDANFDFNNAIVGRYNGTTWTYPSVGTKTESSIQIVNESSFGSYQIGKQCQYTSISSQPSSVAICEGTTTDFEVSASGDGTLEYTWSRNDQPLIGETLNTINTGEPGNYKVIVSGECRTATSDVAVLSWKAPTVISADPVGGGKCAGDEISVTASGEGTVNYQWFLNGNEISNANTDKLSVSQAGDYTVKVNAVCGELTSEAAIVTMNTPTSILSHPQDVEITYGEDADFGVNAEGTGQLTYRWQVYSGTNWNNLTDAGYYANSAGATLNVNDPVVGLDGFQYKCFVSGLCGTVESEVASIKINKALLTVTPVDTNAIYGDVIPVFRAVISGFQLGQNLSSSGVSGMPELMTVAEQGSSTGNYDINADLGTLAAANYDFTYERGNLTIRPATLQVQIDSLEKIYGDANPTLTYSITGYKNGEDLGTSGVEGDLQLTVPANEMTGIGDYTVTVSENNLTALNYEFNIINGNLKIGKATLEITADDKSRLYGDENPSFTFSASGFKNDEELSDSVMRGQPSYATVANALSNVGPYDIVPSLGGLTSDNYNFTFKKGTLSVSKAALTITALDTSRIYGDANPVFLASYSGFKNGENKDVLGGLPELSTEADESYAAGTYVISVGTGTLLDRNYSYILQDGNLQIKKATLALQIDSLTRQYGDANPELTYSFSGFKNSEVLGTSGVTGSLGLTVAATETTGVGDYPVTVEENTLNAVNYDFSITNGNLKIQKAILEISADDQSRLYGDENPAFTFSVTGFKNAEQLSDSVMRGQPAYATVANALSNVGPYNIVPSLGGLTSDNYNFTFKTGTLDVQKAPLTLTAVDKTRKYGEINPVFEIEYNGFKNGQNRATSDLQGAVALTTTADTLSPVGDYTITTGEGDITSNNYQITRVDGTLTVDKSTITVTIENKTRKYGEENPEPTYAFSGFKNSEVKETSGITGELGLNIEQVNTTGIGTYPIKITSNTLDAGNYDFLIVDGNLEIEKAVLAVKADDKSRIYGEPNPEFTITINGYKNGEDETAALLTGAPDYSTVAKDTTSVGIYAIEPSIGNLNAPNYSFTFAEGTLTIEKASLTVTAVDKQRKYGELNPVFEASYTGFKNGEDFEKSDLTGQPSLTTEADTLTPVGTYTIAAAEGELASRNYTLTYVDGNLKIDPAQIAVTIANKTKTYGDANPELTYTLNGFENGEDETSSGMTGAFEISVNADETTGVGEYPIEVQTNSLAASNYEFNVIPGALTIEKATLNVTAEDNTRIYGDEDPTFSVIITGFRNTDDLNSGAISGAPGFTTNAQITSGVGDYEIYPQVGTLASSNYAFNYIKGKLAITPAPLTVTALDTSREYGDVNPVFAASYTGFKNGEDFDLSDLTGAPGLTTLADPMADVGTYTITAANGDLFTKNYSLSFVDGTLTITKATITVSAVDTSRVYGGTNPVFSATYNGFKNGQNLGTSDLTGNPSLTTEALTNSNVGEYPINTAIGGLASTNYKFSFVNGVLNITKASLTVSADNKAKTYGSTNPSLTVTYTGLIAGQTLAQSDVTGTPELLTTAVDTSGVGTYPISFVDQNLASSNYSIVYANGVLTVNKAPITVRADNLVKEYGEANPTLTYTLNGYVLNQDLSTSGVSGIPSLSTNATVNSNAGTYNITPAIGTLAAANYSFVMANGTLTIAKAVLTVKADDKSRAYGAANPTFTATYNGFKLGQDLASSNITGRPSYSTTATAASAVGTYPITITSGNLNSQNYSFSMVNGVLTVNKATVIITANNQSRIYGNNNPALTVTYTGFVNGQNLATSGITGAPSVTTDADSSSNVGTYVITPAEGTLRASNYDFTYALGTLTITKAVLSVTADTKIKLYGDANPLFTASYSGFKLGQDMTTSGITGVPSLTSTATLSSNVGTYPITAAVGTLVSSNYSFTYTNGSLIIGKASLTVTADDKSKTFGSANPAFTITYTGFKLGQVIGTSGITGTPTISTTATAASGVGTYPITVIQGTMASGNYSFTFVNGTLTVNKAVLTVTADNKTKTYGAANPVLTATFTGFVNGQTLATSGVTGSASLTTTADATSPVGAYPISIAEGTLAASNYSFTYANGTLTVGKATVTITAASRSKLYGEPIPAMSYTMNGFVNGEDLLSSDVKGGPNVITAATQSSPVGIYPITVSIGSLTSENYSFAFVNGNLVVNKATIIVKANDASRAYGAANPTFTSTYNGFVNGETLANSGISGTPSYTTTANAASAVGTYPVTPASGTLSSANYAFSFENGTLTVTKATLTVTADNKSRAYGSANPDLTYTVTGFVNGQNLASSGITGAADLASAADASSPVGTYPINIQEGTLAAANYSFTYANGNLNVTKAVITVSANNATRTYGEPNPTFTATYNGFVNGEDIASSGVTGLPGITTTATTASAVGAYPITPATGTLAASNYSFNFVNGTLTITKATLTVRADDKSKVFGSANPTLTASYSGFVNGETLANSGLSGSPALTTPVLTNSVAGKYPINIAQGSLASTNYSFSYQPGTLSVNMGVTFSKQDPICLDGTDGAVTIAVQGANGSTLSYSADNGVTYQSGTTISGLGVGTYKLKVRDADGNESVVADAILNIEIARWIGSTTGNQASRTDWANPANWSNNKVPTSITHVIVPAAFTVNISANASVASIQVAAGATVNVANGIRLTVAGKCGALPN